jgi:hypothetical protein
MIRNSKKALTSDNCTDHIRLLQKFKNELKQLPAGSLRAKKIRGKIRYYHYLPSGIPGVRGTESYLGKDKETLRRQLSRKKFIEKGLPLLEEIIKNQELFLKKPSVFNSTEVVAPLPEAYRDLGYSPILDSAESNHPCVWRNEHYEKSSLHPERLIYSTQNGLRVRSKSESIIAGLLEIQDIPFRYEALLVLDERNYYPDFTILNPQDNQIVYWEHFGMVDNEEYAAAMDRKLTVYKKHGIQPWNNLITTYESGANPFNVQQIRRVIKAFLALE